MVARSYEADIDNVVTGSHLLSGPLYLGLQDHIGIARACLEVIVVESTRTSLRCLSAILHFALKNLFQWLILPSSKH